VIGNNVKVYPGCFVGANTEIGEHTVLNPNVVVYHNCHIGARVIIHAGVVIGSDGFGFAPQQDGSFKKIPQTGNVIIENDVEIGANTVVDRATLGSTIIRKGVKLDNLIQVAHNVEIGEHTVIASQTGISGSTKLGKNVMVGGQVGFAGHITIADGTKFQAQTGVAQSIKQPNGAYAGSPAYDYNKQIKTFITLRNLPDMERRLRELEKQLAALTKPADE
jgi:UDP-3-O-[3-hydroxymyristoyl] glucosamine N-acyltransferase